MDDTITRAEHEEFSRRIDDENTRQNKRIELLENSVREFGSIASSVERLATNMESMCKEQERQGKRLEALESQDGEKWRKAVSYALTAVAGILVGIIARYFGL